VDAVAIVVGVAIAAAGWIANGVLARRAVRRRMRVEYLVSAYRRLEAASNRNMTRDHETAIESAISDVQLFGTPRQVELADRFAREFATTSSADSTPVLEELRTALRAELLLEKIPPRSVWLRITHEGQWAEEEARIRAHVSIPRRDEEGTGRADPELAGLAMSDPSRAILQAYAGVEQQLRVRLPADAELGSAGDFVNVALANKLISTATAEALEGLLVMRNLVIHGNKRVEEKEARDFLALVEGVRYAMKQDERRAATDGE
jgi:hypothetical protein